MKRIVITAFVVMLMSCNKNDDEPKHGIELMTQRSWILGEG